MIVKKYDQFLLLEKYDKNIRQTLIDMGVTDKEELENQIAISKKGYLANYLHDKGERFTFGILKAIFQDAIVAKKRTNLKKGIFSIIPRVLPLALIPFFPTLAILGTIFGSSRLAHKVFDIVFDYINPHSKYTDFLKKTVDTYMKLPEGSVNLKDRFSRAFVVSDRLIDALKPEVINEFTDFVVDKMNNEDDNTDVPLHYIENELKEYLNNNFNVNPKIPLR
jgi:hypothetical protein